MDHLYDKAIHETENYLPEKEVIEVPIENSDNMGGDLIFDEARITDEPIFYNYTTKNGVLIQLIFVKVPDGSLRVGVNLSRECKGEPDAYFEPGDGIFRCVNNGHVSAFGEIGISASAPMGISYSTEAGKITIKEAALEAFEEPFKNWEGPVKVSASME